MICGKVNEKKVFEMFWTVVESRHGKQNKLWMLALGRSTEEAILPTFSQKKKPSDSFSIHSLKKQTSPELYHRSAEEVDYGRQIHIRICSSAIEKLILATFLAVNSTSL